MNFVIRVDASLQIGTGHVMRCLVLASSLRDRGGAVQFICRSSCKEGSQLIEAQGFNVKSINMFSKNDGISENASAHEAISPHWHDDALSTSKILSSMSTFPDWLIVDHYGLDLHWERSLRPFVKKILVIDDLANRGHDCDMLLDQNLHLCARDRYLKLVPKTTCLFLGPRYALINSKFDAPSLNCQRGGRVSNIFVYFGGSDPGDQVVKFLACLPSLKCSSFFATIVLGPIHPRVDAIKKMAEGIANVRIMGATDNMSQLMAEADFAVGTCGVTAWERCKLGLPCIVVVTANNQKEDAEILDSFGAIINLGNATSVGSTEFAEAIDSLISNPDKLKQMSINARSVMEGWGKYSTELLNALFEEG